MAGGGGVGGGGYGWFGLWRNFFPDIHQCRIIFYLALYVMKDFFFIVGIFLLPGIPLQEFFSP